LLDEGAGIVKHSRQVRNDALGPIKPA